VPVTLPAPGAVLEGVLPGRRTDGSPQPSGMGLYIQGCLLFSPCCWLLFALSEEPNRVWDFVLLWAGGCACLVQVALSGLLRSRPCSRGFCGREAELMAALAVNKIGDGRVHTCCW